MDAVCHQQEYKLAPLGSGPVMARVLRFKNCKEPFGGPQGRHSFHLSGTHFDLSSRVVAGTHSGILFSFKKKGNSDMCYNTDKS